MRAWPLLLACAIAACDEAGKSSGGAAPGDAAGDGPNAADVGPDAGRHTIQGPDAAENPHADAAFGGSLDPGAGLLCPPHGPFGTEVGDTLPDVDLVDCEGKAFQLHDLCPRRVGYVFELSGWCPPCRDFAARADALYAEYRIGAEEDFEMFFVVAENDDGGPADAAFCRTIRDQYGLSMPVLWQPEGLFADTLDIPPNEFHIVMGPGNEILWLQHYGEGGVRGALDAAFAR